MTNVSYNCKNGLNCACKPLNKVSVIDAESLSSPSDLLLTPTSICSVQKHLELSSPWTFFFGARLHAEKLKILPKCVLPGWDRAIADIFVKASVSTEPVTASIAFHSIRADLSNPGKRVKCAVTMHTCEWDVGKKTSARGNVKKKKKKAEVEKHGHLLTGDQHQDCKPTFLGLRLTHYRNLSVVKHSSEQRAPPLA